MKKTFAFKGDPFSVFKKFNGEKGLFFLDSSLKAKDSKCSYLGFSPFKRLCTTSLGDLRQEFNKHKLKSTAGFSGGAVGYLSYDGKFCFGFYDQVVVFDHHARTLTIHAPTRAKLDRILSVIRSAPAYVPVLSPLKKPFQLKSNFTKVSYIKAVKKALDHIRRGDIYQINLSRRIEALLPNWSRHANAMTIYEVLRQYSPSPFAAYFDDGEEIILSSSPERFIKLSNGLVEVRPMKGTRPRGDHKRQDAMLKKDLLNSTKEIAELLMVTDLERNDLGRVCDYGSIKVKTMRTIETYQTVFQATATVEGRLHKNKDVFDLLDATFPSGSVTGCPKIEAMKIIKELEATPRDKYTGALGYISFSGDMDFSVLIRSLFLKKDSIRFHVGGGIVADSNPSAEYAETVLKAKAMEAALMEVFGA